MSSYKPFLSFQIEPALLKRRDDFRYKHGSSTRAAAIKRLLAAALGREPGAAERGVRDGW
jgi:hypothetical protein